MSNVNLRYSGIWKELLKHIAPYPLPRNESLLFPRCLFSGRVIDDVAQTVICRSDTCNLLYLVAQHARKGRLSLAEVVGCDMFEQFFPYAAVPQVDIAHAYDTMKTLGSAIRKGLVCSCHDLSEGGLAVTLAEMAIAGSLGVRVDLGNLPPCISDQGGIAFQLPQGGIAEREQLHKNDETSRNAFQVPPQDINHSAPLAPPTKRRQYRTAVQ